MHAVTLHAFTRDADVFVINKGTRTYPDSVIDFRDMGLSLLVFQDTLFSSYEQPRNILPANGSALLVTAVHPTGISTVRTFPMEQLEDGACFWPQAPPPSSWGSGL